MRDRNPVSGMTMTVAITNPVVTHVICSTVTPSEPVRCGTATLTIEASIAPMSVPNVIDSVTSHLLTGGFVNPLLSPANGFLPSHAADRNVPQQHRPARRSDLHEPGGTRPARDRL